MGGDPWVVKGKKKRSRNGVIWNTNKYFLDNVDVLTVKEGSEQLRVRGVFILISD